MMCLNTRGRVIQANLVQTVFPHPVCPHMIAECAVRGRRLLIGFLDEPAIFKIELGIKYEILVYCQIADRLGHPLDPNGHLVSSLGLRPLPWLLVWGRQKLSQGDVCQGQVFCHLRHIGVPFIAGTPGEEFLASSHTWQARIPWLKSWFGFPSIDVIIFGLWKAWVSREKGACGSSNTISTPLILRADTLMGKFQGSPFCPLWLSGRVAHDRTGSQTCLCTGCRSYWRDPSG